MVGSRIGDNETRYEYSPPPPKPPGSSKPLHPHIEAKAPVTRIGAFVTVIAGEAAVVFMSTTKSKIRRRPAFLPDVLKDLNVGIVALSLNATTLLIERSFVTKSTTYREVRRHPRQIEEGFMDLYIPALGLAAPR
jgi:hypothetical protein